MWFWGKQHRHCWVAIRVNKISDGEHTLGEVLTYRCYRCGSIRYDRVDGGGFVSSKVTDDKGNVVTQ
jgi:hypothetical protein